MFLDQKKKNENEKSVGDSVLGSTTETFLNVNGEWRCIVVRLLHDPNFMQNHQS